MMKTNNKKTFNVKILSMKQDFEKILAHYIAKIIPDLQLIDACHYVCNLSHRRYANIGDLVDAATELHFFPRTLRFSGSGDFRLEWGQAPIIMLDMEFFNQGVRLLFRLTLEQDCFGIELERIRFGDDKNVETPSPDNDTKRLIAALNDACLRKNA